MSQREEMKHEVAQALLQIGAVVFAPDEPFTWASGIRSPIYVDNRLTMSHPSVRRRIAEGFAAVVAEQQLEIDAVVGTATAGIPHAAWLADLLDLPMAYVRGSAKEHGRRNSVEGQLEPGTRVIVIEDLVSTGGSSLEAVKVLRERGVGVAAVLAIFSYGLQAAASAFDDAGVSLHVLSDFETVVAAARAAGTLSEKDEDTLAAWRRRLSSGSPAGGE